MIVTQKQLAECFGVSLRRVQQMQTQGIIHRDREKNGYDLAECNKAYIDHKIGVETGRKKAITKEELQAEHERVKIQISKERLKRLRRESIDSGAAQSSWMSMLLHFRNTLETFPAKIVMEIAGQDTNQAIKTVEGMIGGLLTELAAWDPRDVEDTGDLSDDEEEDEEEADEE